LDSKFLKFVVTCLLGETDLKKIENMNKVWGWDENTFWPFAKTKTFDKGVMVKFTFESVS
jgi:hypothetical protein